MNVITTNKVLLGATIVIAATAAATMRLWMAFPVVVFGLIVATFLVRLLDARGAAERAGEREGRQADDSTNPPRRWADEAMKRHRKLANDLATNPINKHLVGNTWNHHRRNR